MKRTFDDRADALEWVDQNREGYPEVIDYVEINYCYGSDIEPHWRVSHIIYPELRRTK